MRRLQSVQTKNKTITMRLPLKAIRSGLMPRRFEDENGIIKLAASIAKHGLLAPLVVSRTEMTGSYRLICGHRRFHALQLIGECMADVICIQADEQTAAACMLEEHLTRSAEPYWDEGEVIGRIGVQALAEQMAAFQADVYERGRIYELPYVIKREIDRQKLDLREVRTVLSDEETNEKIEACRQIVCKRTSRSESGRVRRRTVQRVFDKIDKTVRELQAAGIPMKMSVCSKGERMYIQIILESKKE